MMTETIQPSKRAKSSKTFGETPMSSGIGESKVFGGGGNAPAPVVDGREVPDYLAHAIPHGLSDAGIGGRNDELGEIRVQMGADPIDKADAERYDAVVRNGVPLAAAPDIRKTIADGKIRPGYLPRYVSPRSEIPPEARGLSVVRDEKGDPVKWGNMILTEYPASMKRAREIDKESRSREIERQIDGERHEAAEQLAGRSLPYRPAVQADEPTFGQGSN